MCTGPRRTSWLRCTGGGGSTATHDTFKKRPNRDRFWAGPCALTTTSLTSAATPFPPLASPSMYERCRAGYMHTTHLSTPCRLQMRQRLKMDLPLNFLYKFPTIEALVERIQLREVDPTADFGVCWRACSGPRVYDKHVHNPDR